MERSLFDACDPNYDGRTWEHPDDRFRSDGVVRSHSNAVRARTMESVLRGVLRASDRGWSVARLAYGRESKQSSVFGFSENPRTPQRISKNTKAAPQGWSARLNDKHLGCATRCHLSAVATTAITKF